MRDKNDGSPSFDCFFAVSLAELVETLVSGVSRAVEATAEVSDGGFGDAGVAPPPASDPVSLLTSVTRAVAVTGVDEGVDCGGDAASPVDAGSGGCCEAGETASLPDGGAISVVGAGASRSLSALESLIGASPMPGRLRRRSRPPDLAMPIAHLD